MALVGFVLRFGNIGQALFLTITTSCVHSSFHGKSCRCRASKIKYKALVYTLHCLIRLVFRGEPNDSAVLCTDEATYEVKDAETSNSLLILEELSFPEQARRTSGSTNSSGSSNKSPDSESSLPVISFDSGRNEAVPEGEKEEFPALEVLVRSVIILRTKLYI
jgi:hypothetical protein